MKEQPQNEFGPVPARTDPADALLQTTAALSSSLKTAGLILAPKFTCMKCSEVEYVVVDRRHPRWSVVYVLRCPFAQNVASDVSALLKYYVFDTRHEQI